MISCSRPITRRLEWDAGHRVLGHEGKCACLHGHRYAAEITCEAKQLDGVGRVIDFGAVKTIVGAWIDKHWDHNMVLHQDDPLLKLLDFVGLSHNRETMLASDRHQWVTAEGIFPDKKPYIMPGGRNTTAEELAYELYTVCVAHLPAEINVTRVRIYETPNCWADFVPLPEPPDTVLNI